MRKLLAMLTVAALAFTTTFKNVQASPLAVAVFQQHLKKDGTPDKRFKENKATKGPLKKDGTPDMRYKANKTSASKTTTVKKTKKS
ncbi:hypothetical protein FO440_23560 [Mucilaginibacter corticis]|uniref:Uncharacterized protein n=1 Tax=Mucilaginibacter corticis TaxID=2597670 RepID=A0A556M7K7_9SPHI|nr:hypothetical protein [Mucilaginibacter corticis]TSJ35900.1 hypothetical protein FO440_23560 [Mucilaginibacter corticis]